MQFKGGREGTIFSVRRGEVNAYILYDLLSSLDKIRYESHSFETFSFFVSGDPPFTDCSC